MLSRRALSALLPLALLLCAAVLPDDVIGLNERAKTAIDEGRHGDAVKLLEEARALDPNQMVIAKNLAWAYFLRGRSSLEQLRFDGALADYRRASDLNPEESAYRVHLAQLLVRRYRLHESKAVLDGLVVDDPESGDAWLLLGDTLSLQDRLPDAIEAYDRAAKLGTGNVGEMAARAAERTRRQYAVEHDYRTDKTTYFVIRGPSDHDGPVFSVRLSGVLERARSEVCNALGYYPQQRTTVLLYPPDEFRAVTGTHEWVGGLFDRKIRLPIADVERDTEQIEASFRHEFTHLIVSELVPNCPTFVNEGLAEVMENGRGKGLETLVSYLDHHPGGRDAMPRIGDLPNTFMEIEDRDTVSVAYLMSYAFVDHVAGHHGIGAVRKWVESLAAKPLAEAYLAATGRTLSHEEELFRELVRTAR
jgi:tetratricopeptide (TPR) repeat protein